MLGYAVHNRLWGLGKVNNIARHAHDRSSVCHGCFIENYDPTLRRPREASRSMGESGNDIEYTQ